MSWLSVEPGIQLSLLEDVELARAKTSSVLQTQTRSHASAVQQMVGVVIPPWHVDDPL